MSFEDVRNRILKRFDRKKMQNKKSGSSFKMKSFVWSLSYVWRLVCIWTWKLFTKMQWVFRQIHLYLPAKGGTYLWSLIDPETPTWLFDCLTVLHQTLVKLSTAQERIETLTHEPQESLTLCNWSIPASERPSYWFCEIREEIRISDDLCINLGATRSEEFMLNISNKRRLILDMRTCSKSRKCCSQIQCEVVSTCKEAFLYDLLNDQCNLTRCWTNHLQILFSAFKPNVSRLGCQLDLKSWSW